MWCNHIYLNIITATLCSPVKNRAAWPAGMLCFADHLTRNKLGNQSFQLSKEFLGQYCSFNHIYYYSELHCTGEVATSTPNSSQRIYDALTSQGGYEAKVYLNLFTYMFCGKVAMNLSKLTTEFDYQVWRRWVSSSQRLLNHMAPSLQLMHLSWLVPLTFTAFQFCYKSANATELWAVINIVFCISCTIFNANRISIQFESGCLYFLIYLHKMREIAGHAVVLCTCHHFEILLYVLCLRCSIVFDEVAQELFSASLSVDFFFEAFKFSSNNGLLSATGISGN